MRGRKLPPPPALFASWRPCRSLFANQVRDYCRDGRVEANDVQHAAIVRVGQSHLSDSGIWSRRRDSNRRPRALQAITQSWDPSKMGRVVWPKNEAQSSAGQEVDELKAALRLIIVGDAEFSKFALRKLPFGDAINIASINIACSGRADHFLLS